MDVVRLKDMLMSWAFPWFMMSVSVVPVYLPVTVSRLLMAGDFGTLLSRSRFQTAWFSNMWIRVDSEVRAASEDKVVPLLEGRIRGGVVVPPGEDHGAGVGGTVLEIGPGSGNWVGLFSDKHLTNDEKEGDRPGRRRVTHVLGVEPNAGVLPILRARVAQAGLQDVYDILPVGIEDLKATGRVQRESLDCVVSLLCLCSIPEPQRNIKEVYSYLKPGGRWFVYEHVKCSPGRVGWALWAYQGFLNLIWPRLMGGCSLRRETDTWLREAGPWKEIDLANPSVEPWFASVPHVIGVLTK